MSAVAPRVFLVVVDETEEMDNALRYACRRAQRTNGHVALLLVIEPTEFQSWLGVGRVLESEARAQAELRLQTLAANVLAQTGTETHRLLDAVQLVDLVAAHLSDLQPETVGPQINRCDQLVFQSCSCLGRFRKLDDSSIPFKRLSNGRALSRMGDES